MQVERIPHEPPRFADDKGRQWQIKLTVGLIDRVKRDANIELIPCWEASPKSRGTRLPVDAERDVSAIAEMAIDDRLLTSVLWICIEKQAQEQKVDRDAFADSIDGQSLASGWEAMVDAILFFIRGKSPAMAEAIEAALTAEMNLIEKGARMMTATIQSDQTRQILDKAGDKMGKRMQTEMESYFGKAYADSATN